MNRGVLIFYITSGLFLLSGCSRLGERLQCITKANTHSYAEASTTPTGDSALQGLTMDIGVDGSESMVGYVSQVGSRYSDAIRALEGVVASQGLSERTRYWRLGVGKNSSEPQPITPAQFKAATRPEFYCRGSNPAFGCVSSSLWQLYAGISGTSTPDTKVASDLGNTATAAQQTRTSNPKTSSGDSLKILITDLEPDSGAIDLLVKSYREIFAPPAFSEPKAASPAYKANTDGQSAKAIKSNNKVSLLAVRSQFKGTIFPAEQGSFQPFSYSTEGKDLARAGRPFYLILSGPEAAVDEISRQIRKQQTDVAQTFQEVSYSNGLENTIGLDRSRTDQETSNWKALRPINAFQRMVPAKPSEWLLAAIKQRKASDANTPIPIRLYTHVSPELIGARLPASGVEVISETRVGLTIKSISEKQGQLSIDAVLEPGNFPRGLQSLQPTLTVTRDSLNQALWADWNSDTGQPSGSKTQNLLLFLSGLKQAVSSESANNPVVKICLGINSASSSNPALLLFVAGAFLLVAGGGIIMAITLNRNKEDA